MPAKQVSKVGGGKQLPVPPASSAAVSKSMKGNRGRDTGPELELRRLLREAGYPGYRLHWKKAPGRPDIAYPGRKVAIFVNGCFWHRCPKCQPATPKAHSDFWERKFELNAERDERKRKQLVDAGWRVVTVWECELRDQPSAVVELVAQVLKSPVS